MKYTDLLKDAAAIVRDKLLWKRFIDGTPLSNDLPFWMADFAAAAVAQERDECAKLCDNQTKELYASGDTVDCAEWLANAIRARGRA